MSQEFSCVSTVWLRQVVGSASTTVPSTASGSATAVARTGLSRTKRTISASAAST
ncbi:hypothetical protein [Kutzneria sp. 744]|uniref:hypothetical protein n=1 Tax=Kutzneria sp. (strain 744) TaxID=345341 RepID=UPI0012FCFE73|nr:hypothetical protein [Kutzneria sp. 744]